MPLSERALEPLLRLALTPGIGPGRLARLLAEFGSAERVLGAPAARLAALPGFGPPLAGRVVEAGTLRGLAAAERALEALARCGAVAITPDDAAYPAAFRQLADRPFLLFAAGDLSMATRPCIAVVGTRAPTPYGRRIATALAGELSTAGYGIVSGMARGIDAAAHAAALDAGGFTVGALGQGIDVVYPRENTALFVRVREEGLLITELPPGEAPRSGNFPRRNRLIAALSEGVLVAEMGLKSGAQHTVGYALELGREVFAVPGPVGSVASAGTNQLLKDGARVVTSAEDVLEELRGVGVRRFIASPAVPEGRRRQPPERPDPAVPARPASHLSPEETRVLSLIGDDPRHVDEICTAGGLTPGSTLGALLALELHGLAEALPGKRYRLA